MSSMRRAIEVMVETNDLAGLAELLQDGNREARRQAAAALGQLDHPGAIDYLLLALLDRDEDVRYEAMKALSPLADESTVKALIQHLVDPCWRVRQTAAEALLRLYSSGTLSAETRRKIRNVKRIIVQPHYSDSMLKKVHDENGKKQRILVPDDFGIGLEWPEEAD